MTDPTDMHREPQPPNDGVDGEPQSQQRQSPAEPDQPDAKLDQTPDDTPAQGDPISDAAALTEECLDWRAFTGNTAEELEREFAVLQVSADALGEESWKCRMRVMIRARAYKRIVGGSKFEAACRKHLHIGKDTAHRIIKWLFAEPKIIREIWDRVLAEAHSARINKNNYIYPSYNKMIKWYSEPDDTDDDGNRANADDAADDTSNDKRSRAQILKSEFQWRDQAQTLKRDAIQAKQEAARNWDELTEERRKHTDAVSTLLTLRREVNRQKQELTAAHTEIARLTAQPPPDPDADPVQPQDPPDTQEPDGDGPDDGDVIHGLGGGWDDDGVEPPFRPNPPEPDPVRQPPEQQEPPQQARLILADMTATTIDHRWGAPLGLLGRVKPEVRARAEANRPKAYALLEYETEADARLAAGEFKTRKILWWAALTPEMDVPAMLKLPVKT